MKTDLNTVWDVVMFFTTLLFGAWLLCGCSAYRQSTTARSTARCAGLAARHGKAGAFVISKPHGVLAACAGVDFTTNNKQRSKP